MSTERRCPTCNRMVDHEQRDRCPRTYCLAKIEWAKEVKFLQRELYARQRKAEQAAEQAKQQSDHEDIC